MTRVRRTSNRLHFHGGWLGAESHHTAEGEGWCDGVQQREASASAVRGSHVSWAAYKATEKVVGGDWAALLGGSKAKVWGMV